MDWEPIRYAHNGDVSIAYKVGGRGPVDILVIGGFVTHLELGNAHPLAARFWERLGSFARLIFFDKRGMGLSDRDAGAYTLENIVDDALAVLDATAVRRPVIFGISEGGAAATMLAATHSERVSAMIQFGTYARVSAASDYPEGIESERVRSFWLGLRDRWGEGDTVAWWAPSRAGDSELQDWWARLIRSGLSPGGASALHEMYQRIDVRPLLPAIRVPTLVMYREDDRIVPSALSQTVARGIPDSREVPIPGGDHLIFVGEQDSILDEIEQFVTGGLASVPADRVLATILFTDIVGSTDHAATVGDRRWRDVLERHDRLASREVGRYRGRIVKSTGDGLLATFDGPARAVRAGAALRDAVKESLGIDLRVGVHTGECELMGDDLGGIGVHIASRVESSADPGEVLVSSTVKDLVVGSGLRFEDRGEREFKGVPGSWRVSAFVHDDERLRGAS
jgi:class 3 adenylate cyclase